MMMLTKYVRAVVFGLILLGGPAMAAAQPPAQEGFVPVDQLAGQTQETMPAAPLVAVAYGVAWAAVLIYLFSIWRRLGTVDREIADVARRVEARSRP